MRRVECCCRLKSIFISGSLSACKPPWKEETVNLFTHTLARKLVQADYRLISGFGLGVGSTVINGALEEIMRSKYKHVDEHLCLRPFPQIVSGSISSEQLWREYREDMIAQAGIVIFIFGNKESHCGNIVVADGMLEEFAIAKSFGRLIIPVGSTGGASVDIHRQMKDNINEYPYLADYIDELGTETDYGKLVELIYKIVQRQQVI